MVRTYDALPASVPQTVSAKFVANSGLEMVACAEAPVVANAALSTNFCTFQFQKQHWSSFKCDTSLRKGAPSFGDPAFYPWLRPNDSSASIKVQA